jgi:hypothetical protein
MKPVHNFDFMKSIKLPLKNILRSDKDINDDYYDAFITNLLFSTKVNKLINVPDYDFKTILCNAIYNCHNIRLQTYNFISAFVFYEYGKSKVLTKINLQYVKLAMKMVSERKTKTGRKNNSNDLHQKFTKFYNKYFSKTLQEENIVLDDKLSQVLNYEAEEIVKNIETNIKEHYIQYVNRYINIYFDLKQKILNLNKIKNKNEKMINLRKCMMNYIILKKIYFKIIQIKIQNMSL